MGLRALDRLGRMSGPNTNYDPVEVAALAGRLRKTHPHLVVTGGQDPYPHFLTVTPTGDDST